MCGIAGFVDFTGQNGNEQLWAMVRRMSGTICHRGPDDEGAWADENAGIALGHKRLAIVDLSPEGHQPMLSAHGRYVMVFNGEVYNFLELRRELEGFNHSFRGYSDTEVMLAAIEQWGLRQAVKRFIGMFAFALWDRQEQLLYLVRDRLGIKPLYYSWLGKAFVFGSELKALKAHPEFRAEVNRDAVALMLRHNYIPAPYSIYKSTYKLLPGTILSIDIANPGNTSTPVPYWSVKQVAERGTADPFSGSEDEAISHLDAILRDAVRLHMVSDVPLGAFLSGGVDSSAIVALMQAQSVRPVKTFSIGFYEQGYNEAGYARAVADYLGAEHNELYVTPEQAMAVIPEMPDLYDEPFSDCSQIPTFLVSELARRHVTVSLSGDGGDELFGGYNRYFRGWNIWRNMVRIPAGLRWVLAGAMTTFSPLARESLFFERLQKLAGIIVADSPEAMYHCLLSQWRNPAEVVINSTEPPTLFTERDSWADLPDFTRRVMYLDTVTYLPDDILTKVDRASMGLSLEARVPFLDHRVVEFAWRVPLAMKVKNGQGKWLLRRVLEQYVPGDLTERPKMGFEAPIGNWLRGALRDWAEDLLSEARLKQEGYLRPEPIRRLWKEHLSGKRDRWYYLWDVLMFQSWLDKKHKVKIIN